ncbi:MAG: hypothetical protein K2L04_00125, partial [Alistipes sp.]|nr:hypothetical protein [Alistipes sp.]
VVLVQIATASAMPRDDGGGYSFASACNSSRRRTRIQLLQFFQLLAMTIRKQILQPQRPALPSAAARIFDASPPAAADEHPAMLF